MLEVKRTGKIRLAPVIKSSHKTFFSINKIMETKCERILKDNKCENVLFSKDGNNSVQVDHFLTHLHQMVEYSAKFTWAKYINYLYSQHFSMIQAHFQLQPNDANGINESFKKLKVQSKIECTKGNEEHLAGNVSNIIDTLNVVLIKPFSPDTLLYLGTPLFLSCTSIQNSGTKYLLLGYIDDIFGSIAEPMYSVTTNLNLKSTLNINSQVYYFPTNPNTLYMCIEHTVNNASNKEKYKITAKN